MKKIKDKLSSITKNEFFKSILIYTIIFIFLSLFIVSIFNKYNRWFIWSSDGVIMHSINLRTLRDLLVNFVRTGQISTFTWHIGNGVDLFSNLTYYVFGDLFAYLSVLVRTKDIAVLYNILVFMRIYFVGISFSCYAKYRKLNSTSSIIGALLFTFSSFVLYDGPRHSYHMSSLIMLPLLMMGIEKIIIEGKPTFFTIIVAMAYIVNFYFAYPMSVTIAIYGVILAIKYYKKDGLKKIIKVLLKTLCYSLLGIMISSILLLPTVTSILNSQRTAGNLISSYTISYYRKLAYSIIHLKNSGFWIVIGTQSLIFITLPLTIFKNRKENSSILLLLLVLLLPLLFAPIGSIFMFFSFPYNRWSYVYPFIFAVIGALFINKDQTITQKDMLVVFLGLIAFIALNKIMEINLNNYFEIQIALIFVWLIVFYFKDKLKNLTKKFNLYNLTLIGIVTLGIGFSIKYIYDIDGHSYVSDFRTKNVYNVYANTSDNTIPDFNLALNYIKEYDNDFYKISKYPYAHPNVSLLKNFNSTGYFESIIPKNYYSLNLDLNNSKFDFLTGFHEFDYRTKINTFMGVKYLINYKNGIVPYGYSKIDYEGKSKIYENNYYLPFATLYTNYISEEEYNNLSSLEKESCLLKATVLENKGNLNHNTYDYSKIIHEVKFNLDDANNILNNNNIVITESKKNSFKIEIDEVKNSELYVLIKNLHYTPYTKEEMINLNINEESTPLEIAKVKKSYKWYQLDTSYSITAKYGNISSGYSEDDKYMSPYLENLPEILLNLGYYEEATGTINIKLSKLGNYSFDDIKVYAVSMDDYEEDINDLRKSNFEIVDYGNGYLNGIVDPESDGILQFQTMYDKGWKVYVDGKETEILKSNKYFLGINITKGHHEIKMEYHTPYFKEGAALSFIGIGIFIGTIVFNKKHSAQNKMSKAKRS